jgi:HEAT repeat protein
MILMMFTSACVPNIAKLQEEKDIQKLVEALAFEGKPEVRAQAAKALGELQETSAIDQLVGLFEDSDATVRTAAVEALGQMGDSGVITDVISILKDEDAEVVQAAQAVLLGFGGEAVAPLIDIFSAADSAQKEQIADMLLTIGEPAISPLIENLDNPVESINSGVRDTLVAFGEDAVPALLDTISDSERWEKAQDILLEIGDPSFTALFAMLEDDAQQEKAVQAIMDLGKPAIDMLREKYISKNEPDKERIYIEALLSIFEKQESAIIKAAAGVCQRKAFIKGAAFALSSGDIHPMVIINSSGEKHEYTDSLPLAWRAFYPEELEVVICLEDQTTEVVEKCKYTHSSLPAPFNIRYINRKQYKQEGVLYAVVTGKKLADISISGSKPNSCPSSAKSIKDIFGSETTYAQLETWLKNFGFNIKW